MNYFEMINKCLVELNFKQVSSFAELTKNDHKKLKNILNIINSSICRFDNWNFLIRNSELVIPSSENAVINPINGKIISLVIDNQPYKYIVDFENYITKPLPDKTFTAMGEKLIFPKFKEDKTAKITYYSRNTAIDINGQEKLTMENDNDQTLIPEPFAEPLLVYGACMRLKANPQHVKFSYWYSMYKEALAEIKSQISVSAKELPYIKMYRQ